MSFLLNPRWVMIILLALPVTGVTAVHPQAGSAFVMGAWAGVLIAGPPIFLIAWILRIQSLADTLRPLTNLPILIALTVALLYFAGGAFGPLGVFGGVGVAAWWIRRKVSFGLL
jgi:hypothetical protein